MTLAAAAAVAAAAAPQQQLQRKLFWEMTSCTYVFFLFSFSNCWAFVMQAWKQVFLSLSLSLSPHLCVCVCVCVSDHHPS